VRVGAVVQARMSSARLPGKTLAPLGGRPALALLLERLEHAEELDVVVVATSTEASDDPVAEFCEQAGVPVHRGSLDDVASRVLDAARAHDLDALVRINGDSPLLDQRLVDRAVAKFRAGEASIVTNVAPRSFPRGQSVEVIATAALAEALADVTSAEDREHVTPALYRRGDELEVENISAHGEYNHLHLTLDTEADRDMIEAILEAMDRPHWEYTWKQLLELREAAL
jgi:spore coat polysaccharide biosynthesis protein SpsF